jgi:hypothetical protein
MGTGIGSTAAMDLDFFPQDPGQRLLQLALDGVVHILQTLPTPVTGSVITNIKPQIPQAPSTPVLLPAHCRRKTEKLHDDHTPEHGREHNA